MMNFSLPQRTPKKLSALVCIVALVIVFLLSKKAQLPTQILEQPVVSTLEQPKGIQTVAFDSSVQDLPESLHIFSTTNIPIVPDVFAENLANKIGMKKGPVDHTWIDSAHNTSLTVSPRGNISFLADVPNSSTRIGSGTNLDSYIATATKSLSVFLDTSSLLVDEKNISYGVGGEENSSIKGVNSTTVIIPFTKSLDGYSVLYNDNPIPLALVSVNANLQVPKMNFSSPIPPFTQQRTSPTYTLDQISDQIKQGHAQILTTLLSQTQVQISELQAIQVHSINTEYRYSSSSSLIYPYFLLDTTGTTLDNRTLSLRLLVPAVPIQ